MHYSECFNIPHTSFVEREVYDGVIDADSRLHIDPMLLKGCIVPEFVGAYEEFINYFKPLLHLVPAVKKHNLSDRFYREIIKRLTFREIPNTGLGYSVAGKGGTGISGRTTTMLAESACDIITAGIKDPEIFAIVHFIEEGIGSDRISDMVIAILKERFLKYSHRISKELSLPCQVKIHNNTEICVPVHNMRWMIFIPCGLLCRLPIAHGFVDIDSVSDYNRRLRKRLCEAIGISWKDAMAMKKADIKNYLLSHQDILNDVLAEYKVLNAVPYDFNSDESGEYADIEVKDFLSDSNPLSFAAYDRTTPEDVFNIAKKICEDFVFQVEERGMWRLLYNDNTNTFKKEEASQLVFFLVASYHCKANDIDLNRENDSGVGEIDIKLSSGNSAKTIIELKRISSNQYMHGYEKQLPEYMESEQTPFGIYVVLLDEENCQTRMNKLLQMKNKLGAKAPHIIFVDALRKEPASKS